MPCLWEKQRSKVRARNCTAITSCQTVETTTERKQKFNATCKKWTMFAINICFYWWRTFDCRFFSCYSSFRPQSENRGPITPIPAKPLASIEKVVIKLCSKKKNSPFFVLISIKYVLCTVHTRMYTSLLHTKIIIII